MPNFKIVSQSARFDCFFTISPLTLIESSGLHGQDFYICKYESVQWKAATQYLGFMASLVPARSPLETNTPSKLLIYMTWGSMWILMGYWRMWGCNERCWPVSYHNITCTNKSYWYQTLLSLLIWVCLKYSTVSQHLRDFNNLSICDVNKMKGYTKPSMVMFWRYCFTSTARPKYHVLISKVRGPQRVSIQWQNYNVNNLFTVSFGNIIRPVPVFLL